MSSAFGDVRNFNNSGGMALFSSNVYQFFEFPFDKIDAGENIILYGAGLVGKNYIAQILHSDKCNVSYIVDQCYAEIGDVFGIPVRNPQELNNLPPYRIVIAMADERDIESAIELLKALSIDKKRCIIGKKRRSIIIPQENKFRFGPTLYMSLAEAKEKFGVSGVRSLINLNSLLKLKRVVNHSLTRIGGEHDGGYVMLDDFAVDNRIAYSFGINQDVAWDDAMADIGFNVYMYDHTINDLPHTRNKFHFFKQGIADTKEVNHPDLNTLPHFIRVNGHNEKQHMILKMDVEGAEYGFIANTPAEILSQFDQIVLELHNLLNYEYLPVIETALAKLNETHQLIHIHANNSGHIHFIDKFPYCWTYEVLYVNNKRYDFVSGDDIVLPLPIDAPCNPQINDFILGYWNSRPTVDF